VIRRLLRLATALALAAAAAVVTVSLWTLPAPVVDLPATVAGALDASSVEHPVTAVLLNFRAFDTLLEVAVLLVALLGAHTATRPALLVQGARDPVLDVAARTLIPVMLLAAVYLLWAGAVRPGGAFQGAAVIAAAGVLLVLAGLAPRSLQPVPAVRALLVLGPAVFLVVAVTGGAVLLALPTAEAKARILLVESALTISLALVLVALFLCLAGAPPEDRSGPGARS
jgi:multisubunit Na+/H+ antiporter MnhB subunit